MATPRAAFIGTWIIVKSEHDENIPSLVNICIQQLEGVKFRLDEDGDVTWFMPDVLKSVPLFKCETYEIYVLAGQAGVVLRIAAYAGHVFEFYANKIKPTERVTLTCDGLCVLQCKRCTDETEVSHSVPHFTLLPALEEGFFSDLTITASNNKQFKVHTTVLELLGKDIEWTSDPPPFSNIPEDVLGIILHFLYSECLPDNLTEETLRQVIVEVKPYPSLNKLFNMCHVYLKNIILKKQINDLVNDMHSCINQIIDRFQPTGCENIVSNPTKLYLVVKQSIRDAAVAAVKLLLLCDLFTKRKNELSREGRHEIIRYAKLRLPVFLSQITRLLKTLKGTFGSMSPAQRTDIATFLVPEVEVILDTMSMLIVHMERAIQQIMSGLVRSKDRECNGMGDRLSKSLQKALRTRQLSKMGGFREHISCSLGILYHKKENFGEMSLSQRVRSITRTIEQLIDELPIFLIKLEENAPAFDEKLEWSEFKFCFTVGTSKMSDIIDKLTCIDSIHSAMTQLCELVQMDVFTQTLQALCLLNAAAPTFSASEPGLAEVPSVPQSRVLPELCLQLLTSGKKSDMEFEIVGNSFHPDQKARGAVPKKKSIIKSHRVVVAARCDWFRRALSSGMREAIDKKIVIHDTSRYLFRKFLEYLYSETLRQASLSMDLLVELLLLSDRYETDSLKVICERELTSCVDGESVFYFLSMADQYNAATLKTRCLNYLSRHNELTDTEEFLELPLSLQAEVFDSVWTQPTIAPPDALDQSLEHLLPTSSASSNSLDCGSPVGDEHEKSIRRMMMRLNVDPYHCPDSSSLEDSSSEEASSQMEACVAQMRDIVGDNAPTELLVHIIRSAHFNLRRALSNYYSLSGVDE